MTEQNIVTEERKLTKNLARCKPTEFAAQCVKIRHVAEKWIKDIDIINIRADVPDFKPFNPDMTEEEKARVTAENKKVLAESTKEKLLKVFDNMFEKYPSETLTLLALLCFVEPEDVDNYEMADYMEAVFEMARDRAVINFFTFFITLAAKSSSMPVNR